MSKFYKYISKELLRYFEGIKLQRGERYSLQLENSVEVDKVYSAIKNVCNELEYKVGDFRTEKNYSSYYIVINNVRLLVAKTDRNIHPDYLTYLRNSVDTSESEFENTSLLFIHNTSLDSIIGGTRRLESEGMPLNIKSIEKKISESILSSDLPETDKRVLDIYLDKRSKNIFETNSSIFDFEDIFNILEQKYIEDSQFVNFGMFLDGKIDTFYNSSKDKSLDKRIIENMEIFDLVNGIHKFSDVSDLEQHFESNGVSKLSVSDWADNEFDEVFNSKQIFDKQKKPKYLETELKNDNSNYIIWDRPNGESKTQIRSRNMIVFNPQCDDLIVINLRFDSKVSKEDVKSSNKKVDIKTNNKRLILSFDNTKDDYRASRITYFNLKFDIIVVNIEAKYLENIRDRYFINTNASRSYKRITVVNNHDNIILNKEGLVRKVVKLEENNEDICIEYEDRLIIECNNIESQELESVELDVFVDNHLIPLNIKSEILLPLKISHQQALVKKYEIKSDLLYSRKIDPNTKKESVIISTATRSYYPTGEFRKFLEYEEEMVNSEGIYFEIRDGKVYEESIKIPSILENKMKVIFDYYRSSESLPSLIYMNDDFEKIIIDFLDSFFKYVDSVDSNEPTNHDALKNINKIGLVYDLSSEEKIHFAPWHPINLMYQIKLKRVLKSSIINDELSEHLRKIYLVPYIMNDSNQLFKSIEQDVFEWITYVKVRNSKYNSTNKYVPRIVASKIKDFVTHFEYLFMNNMAPLKIGLVNLGDCNDILRGIFDYYLEELKDKKEEDLRPIELHIYDNQRNINAFEELTEYNDIEEIKDVFGLKLKSKLYDERDILNVYRKKVHFYKYDIDEVRYSHLSFYKMSENSTIGNNNMKEIEAGLSIDGLVSNLNSTYANGQYVTAFGTKYLQNTGDEFIERVIKYNSFSEYINQLSAYNKNTVLATAINGKETDLLKNIYQNSYWITFIDPKVDLNYFTNNDNTKDLMIIHYSDQYSESNGYDAITVTQKSQMYIKVIEEFLKNEIEIGDSYKNNIPEIINSFNVFNGEWLLRLVSRKLQDKRDQFTREKLSLFAAVKLFEAINLPSNVFWIPISSEELVRVSGNSGLRKSESLFSPKIGGAFSDDILMLGIKVIQGKIHVMYYPIEVKIGNNGSEVSKKAKEQVIKATKHYKNEMFGDDKNSLYAKLIRTKLMQIAITQTKKIKMYNMWDEEKWNELIDENIIARLLSDDYELVEQFEGALNDCGVITFTKNQINRLKYTVDKDGYVIDYFDYPMHDVYTYLSKSLREICEINDVKLDDKSETNITMVEPLSIYSQKKIDTGTKDKPSEEVDINYVEQVYEHIEPLKSEIEIVFGENSTTGEKILWKPNSSDKVMHTNTGIIGTMGTGKTQFTKSMITQLKWQEKNNVEGKKIGILIFDYKGDYIKDDFIKATDAKVYNLYNLPFNPLSIYQGDVFKPMLPLHIANELRDTISKAYNLGNVQRNTLSDLLEEAYESFGIIPFDQNTWNNAAPTVQNVFDLYMNKELPTNDSLYAALNEVTKFRVFESDTSKTKPLFDLIDGVTVISLNGYSESIQNLVVAITLDTFYSQMQARGHSHIEGNYRQITNMILVDEADNFLSKDFNSIKKILKEGREFGVGTILSTQFLKHFSTSDNEFSQYILTWVIHKVNEISNKEVGSIFSMTNKNDQESWVSNIKNLEKHYSIINLGGDNKPKCIRDRAFWELKGEKNENRGSNSSS